MLPSHTINKSKTPAALGTSLDSKDSLLAVKVTTAEAFYHAEAAVNAVNTTTLEPSLDESVTGSFPISSAF
jgi:hypothetical protein